MKRNIILPAFTAINQTLIGIVMMFCIVSCNIDADKPTNLQITSEKNITSYLEANSSQFSLLLELLNRDITLTNGSTIKYGSFLDAYGEYTLFAPTNDAITAYLSTNGYSSVSDISEKNVEDLLNFHILQDTISTSEFTDGKLTVATMYGQYLVVGSSYDGSTTKILVNHQAYITTKNITLGNGIIHVIDGVLEPAKYTIAQMLENDGGYTIFVAALKATGYYDTLNIVSSEDVTSRRWLSVMATPDSVYKNVAGIADYPALYNKYCNTTNPLSNTDSLNLYIGYHIVDGLHFIADFNSSSTYATLTSNQIISITIHSGSDTLLINEQTVNGILEKGVPIQRSISDNSSKNGVWHVLGEDYYIKIRTISRVFFDLADNDVLRSAFPSWGTPYATSATYYSSIAGIEIAGKYSGYYSFQYNGNIAVTAAKSSSSTGTTYINYNNIGVNFRLTSATKLIRFTTPFIAAGEYKVWFAWRRSGKSAGNYVTATCGTGTTDSTEMAITPDLFSYMPSRGTRLLYEYDNYLEGLGLKRPMQISGAKSYLNTVNLCKYLGKVTFTTSGKHWIKFEPTTNGNGTYTFWLDYVEFIPVDADQIWPKYDQDGTKVPRPTNDEYDDGVTAIN